MNYKTIGLASGAAVLILGAGSLFFLSQQDKSSKSIISPISTQTDSTKSLSSTVLKDYTDPSGFSFSYPDDLSLSKNEIADDLTYADLDLKSNKVSGNLNLIIQETKLTSADEWFKEKGLASVKTKDVKWGTMMAKSTEDKGKIIIAAVDQGVLFAMEIDARDQKDFWQETLNPILQSFSFGSGSSQETAPSTTSSSSEDVVLEGEEIVE